MTKAFELAHFVPRTEPLAGDGVVVSNPGPPFETDFVPVVTSSKSNVIVQASIPAATGEDQILISGAAPNHDWILGVNPAAAAVVPPPNAQYDIVMANVNPDWAAVPFATVITLVGVVTNSSGASFIDTANVVFAPSSVARVRLDGGDPGFSRLDNFSWDAGTF